MRAPKVFVSYSHDSSDHKAWVLKLASDLRAQGIDVILDRWDLVAGQDVSMFMQKGIEGADRVLMICSADYVQKAEAGRGGVGYERLIVTAEVVQSIDTIKFIPILRANNDSKKVPQFMGPRLYIDFEDDAAYAVKLEELAREIHGAPALSKPPLGENPFSGTPIGSTQIRTLGPMGTLPPAEFLDSDWFSRECEKAQQGIKKRVSLTGHMELRVAITHEMSKSQIELLNAVKHSEIQTFGWPIAVTLENREEYKPRPYQDGIRAEVSIGALTGSGRTSYDYWALSSRGDFYLLQSLFEDSRQPQCIFFDTRIVRVTESLMFAEKLYKKLGASPDAKVLVRINHRGIAGRTLTSASSRRYVTPKIGSGSESTSEVVTILGTMKQTRVDDVRKLLEPMFMLFDFQEFSAEVYDDIVRGFEKGEMR